MDSEETNKRFDDTWNKETVDCNDCELWWNNSCDGVKPCIINTKDSTKLCKLFVPTRKVYIPYQIEKIRDEQNAQWYWMWILWVINLLLVCLLGHMLESKGVI